jgi:peptidoglycan/LPS O-acetylase OafA/YrhL
MLTYLAQLVTAIGIGWLFFVLVERRFISRLQQKRIETELQPGEAVPAASNLSLGDKVNSSAN